MKVLQEMDPEGVMARNKRRFNKDFIVAKYEICLLVY